MRETLFNMVSAYNLDYENTLVLQRDENLYNTGSWGLHGDLARTIQGTTGAICQIEGNVLCATTKIY